MIPRHRGCFSVSLPRPFSLEPLRIHSRKLSESREERLVKSWPTEAGAFGWGLLQG